MNEVDAIRIEQFRQFKKEIRGSREYEVVGIDVAKEKHHAFFGTATGKTLLRNLVIGNDLDGFCKLIEQAEALRVQEGLSKVVYGLEPTGDYHKPLGEHLIKCAKLVVLVSGVALKRNRELLDGRWDKHDVKDAANVADLTAQGKCMFYEYPDSNVRNLRVLLSLKMRLRKYEHGLRVRIRNHLVAQYFPELDRVTDVNYFSRSATIIIPGSPLPPKPAPYPMRVKRREPVGRPEIHPLAAGAPPRFPPSL
jgi:hypothetical protein